MFHCVFRPPCLCLITDRRVLCSTVSLVHRVYVSPQEGEASNTWAAITDEASKPEILSRIAQAQQH